MARRGYVYCIANDAIPSIVKIGATVRDPEDRLREARATTWAPSCFRIIAQVPVDDAFATERALHALLAARRFEVRREFFTLTHEEARAVFDVVALVSGAGPAPHTPAVAQAPQAHVPGSNGDSPNIATPETKIREWVEANYTRISRSEKDAGTKLEALYSAYASAAPPVHVRVLGRNKFAKMLSAVFPNVGPHKSTNGMVGGLYLLRSFPTNPNAPLVT